MTLSRLRQGDAADDRRRGPGHCVAAGESAVAGQAAEAWTASGHFWRSIVIISPSTAPRPTRPLTSALVIAFSCQPSRACLLRSFSSSSPACAPPHMRSRSSTTLYSTMTSHLTRPFGHLRRVEGNGHEPPTRTVSLPPDGYSTPAPPPAPVTARSYASPQRDSRSR